MQEQTAHVLTTRCRWLSSHAVTLTAAGVAEVSLPGEILRQRSTVLRNRMSNADTSVVDVLSDDRWITSTSTFHALVAWITSAVPQVQEQDGLDHVVQMAILADKLGIWGLCNQAADLLDHQVSDGGWKLTPMAVNAVYTQVAEERPLRKWMAARVNTIVRDLELVWLAEQNKWKPVFQRHASLGWDLAVARLQSPSDTSDPCRSHEHPWVRGTGVKTVPDNSMLRARKGRNFGRTAGPTCPYLQTDHYPTWTLSEEQPAKTVDGGSVCQGMGIDSDDGEVVDQIFSD